MDPARQVGYFAGARLSVRCRHALVVGKFAPLHAGHQLLIEAAVRESQRVTVLCYATPDFPAIPSDVRAGWIRSLYPTVEVHIPEDAPADTANGPIHWAYLKSWLHRRGLYIDAVFSSEQYGEPLAQALGEKTVHRMIDQARLIVPVSGTQIRRDIHASRTWMNPLVYRHFIEKVVFVGAESTGKTTLAQHLAREYDTAFVPEIGRSVWEAKAGKLCADDYLEIVRLHRQAEEGALDKARHYLFVDTNALTTLLLGFCYGHLRHAPADLLMHANSCRERYQHHFLCEDDIPFHQDGWRDDSAWRSRIQGTVRYDLQVRGIAHTSLRGSLVERAADVKRVLDASRRVLTR